MHAQGIRLERVVGSIGPDMMLEHRRSLLLKNCLPLTTVDA
jgi:hypothetical protein